MRSGLLPQEAPDVIAEKHKPFLSFLSNVSSILQTICTSHIPERPALVSRCTPAMLEEVRLSE